MILAIQAISLALSITCGTDILVRVVCKNGIDGILIWLFGWNTALFWALGQL